MDWTGLASAALGGVAVGALAYMPQLEPALPAVCALLGAAPASRAAAPLPPPAAAAAKAPELPTPEQTLALLKKRRSIFPKDYNGKGRAVSERDVRLMLEAATWAPTHKRTEPWRFVVFSGAARARVWECTLAGNAAAYAATGTCNGETYDEVKQWFAEDVDAEWSKCEWVVALCMRAHAKPEKPALPEWEELSALRARCRTCRDGDEPRRVSCRPWNRLAATASRSRAACRRRRPLPASSCCELRRAAAQPARRPVDEIAASCEPSRLSTGAVGAFETRRENRAKPRRVGVSSACVRRGPTLRASARDVGGRGFFLVGITGNREADKNARCGLRNPGTSGLGIGARARIEKEVERRPGGRGRKGRTGTLGGCGDRAPRAADGGGGGDGARASPLTRPRSWRRRGSRSRGG